MSDARRTDRAHRAYRGLDAVTWDLLRGDTSGWPDRGFYLEVIERYGSPVIDVGCGGGRLLLDYRGLGLDVDGVDASCDMLSQCRARAAERGLEVQLWEQPMQDLALPRRYRTVLVPSSSFQLLTDPSLARRALERLLAHLEPGGALVMSFMELWRPGEPLEHDWRRASDAVDGERRVSRHERFRFDPETRIGVTESRIDVEHDGVCESEHHSLPVRSYAQPDVVALCESAGFAPVHVLRGFTWQAAVERNRTFCVLAERAVD